MVVRIRFAKRRARRGPNRRVALAVAALLSPAALMAFVLGFWRIAAEFQWANRFAIASGVFSHWEVWLGAAALLQFCAYALNRYGRNDPTAS
jgi:hypothetical protein